MAKKTTPYTGFVFATVSLFKENKGEALHIGTILYKNRKEAQPDKGIG